MDVDNVLCFVTTFFIVLCGGMVFLIWLIHSWTHKDKPAHNPRHPGLTVNTITGKRDVICPKCNSPYCHYVYENVKVTNDRYYTSTKVHPLNVFKPFVEEKTVVKPGATATVTKFRCNKCGYIFS